MLRLWRGNDCADVVSALAAGEEAGDKKRPGDDRALELLWGLLPQDVAFSVVRDWMFEAWGPLGPSWTSYSTS